MARRTASEWNQVLIRCGVKPITAAHWSTVFAEVIDDDTFSAGDSEIPDFLGQILHESSALDQLEEGLFYKTPGRLMATWPSRFKTLSDELPYLRNPRNLANKVYGGRMGNTWPDDGWLYRGSGLIQVTGADNFKMLQQATGVPIYDNPDLLRKPSAEALRVAIAWWEGNVPDSIMGDIVKVTRRVNGGNIGLADRRRRTDESREALG